MYCTVPSITFTNNEKVQFSSLKMRKNIFQLNSISIFHRLFIFYNQENLLNQHHLGFIIREPCKITNK